MILVGTAMHTASELPQHENLVSQDGATRFAPSSAHPSSLAVGRPAVSRHQIDCVPEPGKGEGGGVPQFMLRPSKLRGTRSYGAHIHNRPLPPFARSYSMMGKEMMLMAGEQLCPGGGEGGGEGGGSGGGGGGFGGGGVGGGGEGGGVPGM